jgi:hypothetical protein
MKYFAEFCESADIARATVHASWCDELIHVGHLALERHCAAWFCAICAEVDEERLLYTIRKGIENNSYYLVSMS